MPTRAELPSSRKLIRSTVIAILAAIALLVTVVLPAEYAIDPTGVGKVLGLTEMGQIKQQLAEEAEIAEAAEIAEGTVNASVGDAAPSEAIQPAPTEAQKQNWQDVVTVTLAPGEAAEVKLTMEKDGIAQYEWVTNQGHLNSDLHADGSGRAFISYRKGRAEVTDAGELTAEFDGSHGWFWRNRSDVTVEITLNIRGAYSDIKRML
nr:transmembrane anchor protein [Robiginitomaculum antarcticum]